MTIKLSNNNSNDDNDTIITYAASAAATAAIVFAPNIAVDAFATKVIVLDYNTNTIANGTAFNGVISAVAAAAAVLDTNTATNITVLLLLFLL